LPKKMCPADWAKKKRRFQGKGTLKWKGADTQKKALNRKKKKDFASKGNNRKKESALSKTCIKRGG